MSKFSKLMKNPSLFFSDFFAKKAGVTPKKVVADTKTVIRNNTSNIDLSHVNFCRSYSIVLHSGESVNAGVNQLIPWISILLQGHVDFVLLVRNEALYKWAKTTYPWLSIAFAKRGVDVEELIKLLPDVSHVLYPSSTGNNIHIVRFNHLEHIFIGHGDSDKASSAHKALRLYDEVWTAGQAHIDRFKKSDFYTGHLKFLKVGRPNLLSILEQSQDDWSVRMQNKILYLPTWEGVVEETNYSSTHLSGKIIQTLIFELGIPISVKYHPFTGNRNTLLKNIGGKTSQMIKQDALNANLISSDVELKDEIPFNNIFICDISGVVSECLAANGPIFVYIPSDREVKIASSAMKYEDYCYTYSSIEELVEKLKIVLSGDDYLELKRKEAIDYFIGAKETLDGQFIEQLKSIINGKNLKYVSRLFDEL